MSEDEIAAVNWAHLVEKGWVPRDNTIDLPLDLRLTVNSLFSRIARGILFAPSQSTGPPFAPPLATSQPTVLTTRSVFKKRGAPELELEPELIVLTTKKRKRAPEPRVLRFSRQQEPQKRQLRGNKDVRTSAGPRKRKAEYCMLIKGVAGCLRVVCEARVTGSKRIIVSSYLSCGWSAGSWRSISWFGRRFDLICRYFASILRVI